MAKYKQPCFDSSVFLGKIKNEICRGIKRAVVFDWLWHRAKTNEEFEVYISALTLTEVYKTKRRNEDGRIEVVEVEPAHLDEFLDLISEPFVKVIELDRETALLGHALCRKYNLWPGDGIQLASALKAGCDILIAWDRPLIGKHHDSCRIEEPSIYDKDLFYQNDEIASAEEIAEYEKKHPKAIAAVTTEIPVVESVTEKAAAATVEPLALSIEETDEPSEAQERDTEGQK